MESFCGFFKAFCHIKWTTASMVLCATPLALTFMLLHLAIFVFDDGAGSVVSNDQVCAVIGKKIILEGGSVVDGAIATILCEGVMLPNRAGIGGGFTALMFIDGRMDTLTATPVVPENFSTGYLDPNTKGLEGSKSGGVPGELKGYWDLHQKYGMLPWKSLFEPTIALCEEGIPVTEWLEVDMQRSAQYMYRSKTMRELYRMLQEENDGKKFKFLKLAKTLREIAQKGVDVFYKGQIGKDFVADVLEDGGVITERDLKNYETTWVKKAITIKLPKDLRAYTTPLPSMGAVVALILNVVKSIPNRASHQFWHTVIEAMKHAIGQSFSLSDIENEPNMTLASIVEKTYANLIDWEYAQKVRDLIETGKTFSERSHYGIKHQPASYLGSSNICIIAPNGDAIVLTSSLMWDFQTFFWSRRTGIILNNMIRNFLPARHNDLPPSPSSFVRPGKRAISPHCPVIVLNQPRADVYFAVGASGSELIPSQVASAVINYCFLKKNAYYAANSGFFYPEVMKNTLHISDPIASDADFDEGLLEYLNRSGHRMMRAEKPNPYTMRTCIGYSRAHPDVKFTSHERGGAVLIVPERSLNTFLVIILMCISLSIISVMIYEIVLSKLKEEEGMGGDS